MAKLPPAPDNATPRLYIDYTSAGQRHTAELRLMMTAGPTAATDVYNDVSALMQIFLPTTDSITGARFSAPGTNVSFPLSVYAKQGTNPGTPDPANKPNFMSWTGRSADGRRVRFTLFSPVTAEIERYRQDGQANQYVAAVTNYLQTNPNAGHTRSQAKAIWNNYVNIGVNAYYQRKQRRTG